MQPDSGEIKNSPPRRKLRFGVMCRGLTFPNWQGQCLELLLEQPDIEPGLLIIDSRAAAPASSFGKKLLTLARLQINLFSLYNRYLVARRCRATQPLNLTAKLAVVQQIRCEVVRKGKFSEYFSERDVDAIKQANLDFVLRFGFNIIRGEVLNAARYGVWSFHHGDEQKYRGAPPCFWEIYNGELETGAILQRLTERLDGGVVLKKGWTPTIHHSYPENRDAAHFLGVRWPTQVCADIHEGRAEYLANPPVTTKAPIYVAPTNGQMVAFGAKQTANILRHLVSAWFARAHVSPESAERKRI